MFIFKVFLISVLFNSLAYCEDYDLQITSDSPIAEGTSVTFNVTLMLHSKVAPKGKYQFRYNFDGSQQAVESTEPSILFTVNTEDLKHGHYTIEFAVDEWYFFVYLEKTKKRATFEITNHFTGLMQLTQGPNSTVRDNGYVSTEYETTHNIVISDKDKKLYEKAAYVRVYWFVDCLYVGMTDSLGFKNWYRTENGKYNVEALLMLSFVPLPTPTSTTTVKPTTTTTSTTTSTTPATTTTTTTTTTPTTTTTSTTSTTSTTTSTPITSTTSTTTTKKTAERRRRSTDEKDFEWSAKALVASGSIRPENIAVENMTEPNIMTSTELPMTERIKMLQDSGIPYFGVCTNDTKVILDPKKIYGYYQRIISVEKPVTNVTVSNNIWLKHGDLCRLVIKYGGTPPFRVCTKITQNNESSLATSNGEVSCNDSDWKQYDIKEINYERFLPKSSNVYTLWVFIKNEVSMKVTPIGIQFYEAQPRSQLSVIIVPIIFSLSAVVLIVFGVAYYVQNRNQFLVEVADFNFGETQSIDSLEYKSFLQRLLDSVSDLFIKSDNYNEDPDNSGEPSNLNYSVMP